MQTKSLKFLKLSFEDTGVFYTIKPVHETQQIVEKYLIHKANDGSAEFEMYYPSVNIDNVATPFPKLEKDTEMFFMVGGKEGPGIGKINLVQSTNGNINTLDIIEVRKNLTSFVFPVAAGITHLTIKIKTISGMEIHNEILNVQADSSGNRAIFSFDFSGYSFGIYKAEITGANNLDSIFAIDKTGELTGKFALLRILYDEGILKYKTDNTSTDFKFSI